MGVRSQKIRAILSNLYMEKINGEKETIKATPACRSFSLSRMESVSIIYL